jgi:4-diphosphocytidyl-2-C-methyl-D-erythritol kinase
MADRVVRVEARAKINLFLRVLGRREDGYHDIESLVVPIRHADMVTVRARPGLAVNMHPTPGATFEPIDAHRNLAFIAAREWVSARGDMAEGADISVEKVIPVAAGLGGGSADAAAVLRGLNELWGRPFGAQELSTIGARVGSDVPALLAGRPVLVRGRGEIVEPARVSTMWWVLVPQRFPVSTSDAYRWWDEDAGEPGPDPGPLLEAATRGDVDVVARLAFNDLQAPVLRRHPALEDVRAGLVRAGALAALLCGSGPTIAGLVRTKQHAAAVARRVPSAIAVSGPG